MTCRTLPQSVQDNIEMNESKQLLCDRLNLDSHSDENWRQAFGNVKNLNTHAPGHTTKKFACEILPDAQHTCRRIRTRSEPPPALNVRSSVDAALNDLAVVARQKGVFPENTKRKYILRETQKYNIQFQHLPLVCPSRDQLETL